MLKDLTSACETRKHQPNIRTSNSLKIHQHQSWFNKESVRRAPEFTQVEFEIQTGYATAKYIECNGKMRDGSKFTSVACHQTLFTVCRLSCTPVNSIEDYGSRFVKAKSIGYDHSDIASTSGFIHQNQYGSDESTTSLLEYSSNQGTLSNSPGLAVLFGTGQPNYARMGLGRAVRVPVWTSDCFQYSLGNVVSWWHWILPHVPSNDLFKASQY